MIAKAKNDSVAAYVISMAKVPSDVLAVKLLLKRMGRQSAYRRATIRNTGRFK